MRDPQPAGPVEQAARRFWLAPGLRDLLGGERLLVAALSGGADSLALCRLLSWPGRPAWAPPLLAAHIQHGLRPEAEAELEAARRAVRALGLPFRYRRLDGAALRGARGGSLEDAARRARYRALGAILRRAGGGALVTAHHGDDLAETLLMRLLRGAGLEGLAAFGPRAEIFGLTVLRPLLDWSHEDCRRLCREAGLDWAEDPMNRDPRYLRSRLRGRVIPYLERQGDHPGVASRLAATARRLAESREALEILLGERYRALRLERRRPRRLGLPLEALRGEPALAGPLLRWLADECAGRVAALNDPRLRELRSFALEGEAGGLCQSAANMVAWIADAGDALWLYRKPQRRIPRDELLRRLRAG